EHPVAADQPAESTESAPLGGLPIFDALGGGLPALDLPSLGDLPSPSGLPSLSGLPAGLPMQLPLGGSLVETLPGLGGGAGAADQAVEDPADAFDPSTESGVAGLPVPFLGTPSLDPSALSELPI